MDNDEALVDTAATATTVATTAAVTAGVVVAAAIACGAFDDDEQESYELGEEDGTDDAQRLMNGEDIYDTDEGEATYILDDSVKVKDIKMPRRKHIQACFDAQMINDTLFWCYLKGYKRGFRETLDMYEDVDKPPIGCDAIELGPTDQPSVCATITPQHDELPQHNITKRMHECSNNDYLRLAIVFAVVVITMIIIIGVWKCLLIFLLLGSIYGLVYSIIAQKK